MSQATQASVDVYPCQQCGRRFKPFKRQISRGNGIFCTAECRKAFQGVGRWKFVTPPSTRAERVRANTAVREAVQGGQLAKPDRCQRCRIVGEVVGHHEDYGRPLDVVWLCRSCHAKAHFKLMPAEGGVA